MPPIGQLLFFVAILAIFWLFLIRPAKRQQRAQAALHAALKTGDEVVLSSGIFGRIVALTDDKAEVEIAPGTVITVARQVVVRRIEDEAAAEPDETPAPQPAADPAEDDVQAPDDTIEPRKD